MDKRRKESEKGSCFMDLILSVIVPVYNIAPWLDRCMESVLPAMPEASELLLVTGVSEDESDMKCAQWEQSDKRVRVLCQNGVGLANARNYGVSQSRGKFLLYIDGDDFVDTKQLRWLLDKLPALNPRIQVVMTDYQMTDMSGQVLEEMEQIGSEIVLSDRQEILAKVLRRKKCFWNVWRYIYRRDFLIAHQITFLENTLSEDMDYTAKVYAAQPFFAFAHCPFYRYCVGRGSSLMDRPTLKRLGDTVANIKRGVAQAKKHPGPYMEAFIAQYQFEYLLNIALCAEVPKEDRAEAYRIYRRMQSVLNAGQDPVMRLFWYVLWLCPMPVLAHAAHGVKMIRRAVRGNHRPYEPVKERG